MLSAVRCQEKKKKKSESYNPPKQQNYHHKQSSFIQTRCNKGHRLIHDYIFSEDAIKRKEEKKEERKKERKRTENTVTTV